jgi:hypothetical protein
MRKDLLWISMILGDKSDTDLMQKLAFFGNDHKDMIMIGNENIIDPMIDMNTCSRNWTHIFNSFAEI